MLVESYEPNADYTEWTFHIRDGITFHDGTPLDGAAVEFNMESCQYSPLTGAAYLWIKDDHVVGPGRHDHDERAVRRGAPPVHRAPVRLHVLADVAGHARGRPAAHRGLADLRRRARRDAGDRRPGASRSASAPSCSSRTRRATATRSSSCATRTTGVARTASPVRTCRTSTPSRASWPSTSTAARTRCARASSTSSTRRTPTRIAQFLDDDELRDHRHEPVRRHELHHAQRRRG